MMSIEQVDVRIKLRETIKRAAIKGIPKRKIEEIFQKELNKVMRGWSE